MLLVIGTFRVPAANLAAARPVMQAMVEATRAEDGCAAYSYAEDVLDPGLIHVTELWSGQEALDRHVAAPHLAAWRAAWPGLGIGERDLRRYEVGAAQAV